MILAAGRGERLLPFTQSLPKPFLPVLGVPVIQFLLDSLQQIGVKKIVVNVHHLPDLAKDSIQTLDMGAIQVSISDESHCLMGSGGGIRKALHFFDEGPILILNADTITNFPISDLIEFHFRSGKKATIGLIMPSERQKNYSGIELDEKNFVTGILKENKNHPFFSGISLIEKSEFLHLSEFQESNVIADVWKKLIKEKQMLGFLRECLWFDVGSPSLWKRTHFDLMRKIEGQDFPDFWRKRILSVSEKVEDEFWKMKSAPLPKKNKAPLFWAGKKTLQTAGPRLVFYGENSLGEDLSHGIGFKGHWVKDQP